MVLAGFGEWITRAVECRVAPRGGQGFYPNLFPARPEKNKGANDMRNCNVRIEGIGLEMHGAGFVRCHYQRTKHEHDDDSQHVHMEFKGERNNSQVSIWLDRKQAELLYDSLSNAMTGFAP
jgi:hypothetical protein